MANQTTFDSLKKDEIEVLDNKFYAKSGHSNGRSYSCDARKISGLIALVMAVAVLVLACVLAAGVFGLGTLGLVAGGMVIGSMVLFGIAAYLLVPREPSLKQV